MTVRQLIHILRRFSRRATVLINNCAPTITASQNERGNWTVHINAINTINAADLPQDQKTSQNY